LAHVFQAFPKPGARPLLDLAVTVSTLSAWLDKKRDQVARRFAEMFDNRTALLSAGSWGIADHAPLSV
jgi:hypothetical protein